MLMVMAASVVRRRRYSTRPDDGAPDARRALLRLDQEVSAAVLGPARLFVIGAEGPFLADGECSQAALRHPRTGQVNFGGPVSRLPPPKGVPLGAPRVPTAPEANQPSGVAF